MKAMRDRIFLYILILCLGLVSLFVTDLGQQAENKIHEKYNQFFTTNAQLEYYKAAAEGHYVSLKTTGYSNDSISINVAAWRDGITASGTVARVGTCAADWSVYPVGTVLHVTGYGPCIVEDRGSAVQGQHIDLFFNTRQEALDWGVRTKLARVVRQST